MDRWRYAAIREQEKKYADECGYVRCEEYVSPLWPEEKRG